MKRSRFFSLVLLFSVIFIFAKIYQHNQIVRLRYQVQRIERMKKELLDEKNTLETELCQLQEQHEVRQKASVDLRMQPIQASNIITFTF